MLEKTEWVIKNEQSRDTGNIEHKTPNEDRQTKKKTIYKHKSKKMSNTDPTKKPGGEWIQMFAKNKQFLFLKRHPRYG